MYYLYILECTDKTLYTGITTDLKRRINEHNNSSLGARYTKARRPVKLVYYKKFKTKSAAAKREWAVKKLSRQDKLQLISSI